MKKLLSLLLAAVMVLGLAACGAKTEEPASTTPEPTTSATPAETPVTTTPVTTETGEVSYCTVAEDSDIVIANYSDVASFMPPDQTQTAESVPTDLACDTLLKFDANHQPVPCLATGVTASEDGLTYTFTLREGIFFHDGEPFNAEAVKVNVDGWINPDYAFKSVSRLQCIEKCEVIDDYTVTMTLSSPYAPFLNLMCTSSEMVSPKQYEMGPGAWGNTIIGTGRYKFVEYRSGESMTFELDRNYWGYNPELCGGEAFISSNSGFNTITVKFVSEEPTRIAMLMNGEADVINTVNATNIPTVEANGGTPCVTSGIMIGYVYFNTQKGALQDIRVRKAIAQTIDCAALNQVVYGGRNTPGTSILAPAIAYYEKQEPYGLDIEGAKALLAEAGYANGLTLVAWEENDTSDIQRGEFIQQQLEQIGITLKVFPMEGGTLATDLWPESGVPSDTEWDVYIRGYSASTFDPDTALGRFTTSNYPPVGANYSYYSNPEFDELCRLGANTIVPSERQEYYSKAQKMAWDDVFCVPTLVNSYMGACGPHMKNFSITSDGHFDWESAYYE